MTPVEEERQIGLIKGRLAVKFPSETREIVDGAVNEAYDHFSGKNIRDFVPLLVERRAKDMLSLRVAH